MLKLSDTQRNTLTTAMEVYEKHRYMVDGYLARRNLDHEVVRDGFRLGFVVDPENGHEAFRNRLSIPYLTPFGVVDMKFRCVEHERCEGHAKYLGLPGQEARLFNVQAIHDAYTTIYVTEGELDAIAATVAGCPAVGISGASKWEPHYVCLLDDFQEVVVLADGDDAGRNFGKKVRGEVEHARVVYFEPGEDVGSYFAAYGAARLRAFVGATDGA